MKTEQILIIRISQQVQIWGKEGTVIRKTQLLKQLGIFEEQKVSPMCLERSEGGKVA